MKKILAILLMFVVGHGLLKAQNSVKVEQTGNGNTVSINRSENPSKISQNEDGCNNRLKQLQAKQNKILIKKDNGPADTLLHSAGANQNRVSKVIENAEIKAAQSGESNGLSILLPDSQNTYKRFHSSQRGTKNSTLANLNNLSDIGFSQHGKSNSISVNPCADSYRNIAKGDSLKIKQQGANNSVQINQH